MTRPNPQVFPTQGPRAMQLCAYDPARYDVCADPDCECRMSRNNIRGFGATEQEALDDFWQQWQEATCDEIEQVSRAVTEKESTQQGGER